MVWRYTIKTDIGPADYDQNLFTHVRISMVMWCTRQPRRLRLRRLCRTLSCPVPKPHKSMPCTHEVQDHTDTWVLSIYVCIYVCIYIYICSYIPIIHTYMHAYIHTYVHTSIYIYIYMHRLRLQVALPCFLCHPNFICLCLNTCPAWLSSNF